MQLRNLMLTNFAGDFLMLGMDESLVSDWEVIETRATSCTYLESSHVSLIRQSSRAPPSKMIPTGFLSISKHFRALAHSCSFIPTFLVMNMKKK